MRVEINACGAHVVLDDGAGDTVLSVEQLNKRALATWHEAVDRYERQQADERAARPGIGPGSSGGDAGRKVPYAEPLADGWAHITQASASIGFEVPR